VKTLLTTLLDELLGWYAAAVTAPSRRICVD
jgi:hypothetical protein